MLSKQEKVGRRGRSSSNSSPSLTLLTYLILVLKRDALGLSLLLHHGGRSPFDRQEAEQKMREAFVLIGWRVAREQRAHNLLFPPKESSMTFWANKLSTGAFYNGLRQDITTGT